MNIYVLFVIQILPQCEKYSPKHKYLLTQVQMEQILKFSTRFPDFFGAAWAQLIKNQYQKYLWQKSDSFGTEYN